MTAICAEAPRNTQVVAPDGGGGFSWLGNASRSLVTVGFAHPSGTTFGVSVFMAETPAPRDVPFS